MLKLRQTNIDAYRAYMGINAYGITRRICDVIFFHFFQRANFLPHNSNCPFDAVVEQKNAIICAK